MDTTMDRDTDRKTISLDELYEKLKENQYREGLSFLCKNTSDENKTKSLKITGTLGKGAKGYVFRASNHEEIALKLSYQQDNYKEELETVMDEMTKEYLEYYLNLRWSGYRADYLSIKGNPGGQKLHLDADVYVSAWEIANDTLKDKLYESFEKKLEWFGFFLKGLSVIHARKRAHFDIKLANIFLVNDRVKIGDFELYLKIEEFKRLPLDVCGTPGHIAPEMFYDKARITAQADIFSAGAAFAQLFLGKETHSPPYNDEFINLPGNKEYDRLDKPQGLKDVENEKEFKKLLKSIPEEQYRSWNERKQNLFKINYQIFSSLKKELRKKLDDELKKITSASREQSKYKELKVYRLLSEMMHIDPGKRINLKNKAGIDETIKFFFIPGLLLGRRLKARYRVDEIIDTDGRGIIYKVFDELEEDEKAIKLFPPKYDFKKQDIDDIKNELKNNRQLNHDNIIKVYNLERAGNLNFIVMEYFNAKSLDKEMEKTFHKEDKTLKIMEQVLNALIKAHEKEVTHNAVKPRNIMIDLNYNVRILNFGWNRQFKKALEKFTRMKPDFLELAYVPPEMYPDMWEKNIQADVWAFGVTLYQLITGDIPFKDQFQTKTQTGPAHLYPGLSAKVTAVVLKCLKTDKMQRYANLNEIYRDLFEIKKPAPKPTPEALPIHVEPPDKNIPPDHSTTEKNKSTGTPGNLEEPLDLGKPGSPVSTAPPATPRIQQDRGKGNAQPGPKTKRVLPITLLVIISAVLLAMLILFMTGLIFPRQGPYHIWYSGELSPGKVICFAGSSDGIKWKPYSKNPIIRLENTTHLKGFLPTNPYIVHDNSAYHMLFTLEKPGEPTAPSEIGYASSTDGIHWQIPSYNPVTLGPGNIDSPGPIIYRNHKFHMWYSRQGEIYYAETAAEAFILKLKKVGNTPVLKKGNPGQWDEDSVEPGTVIFDDHNNIFKMWYTGRSNNSSKIGYATSPDGIQWVKYLYNPVYDDELVDREMYPAVVKDQGEYKMYYTAASQESDFYPIMLATSTDGINWKKYSNIPVISGEGKNKIFVTAASYEK
jgi:serine/threonine protein kinase